MSSTRGPAGLTSTPHHQLLVVAKPTQFPSSIITVHSKCSQTSLIVKSPIKRICCTSSSPSTTPVIEEEGIESPSEPSGPPFPLSGCKACGKAEIERGCNGEGRMQGGIATVPGLGWWPIKAYRPCPEFVASGGRYMRQGQSMDEVAGFKEVKKAASRQAGSESQSSKKKGPRKFRS